MDISWITAPFPTTFSVFTQNSDNGINLIKSAHKKAGRTASILDGKQNSK